jgi:pyrimidine 5'-nucleotidase
MHIDTILFDLDETLYDPSTEIWKLIRQRIELYLLEQMHFPAEQIPEIRARLFSTYGTTLRGLQMEHHIDAEAYLDFVHDIPIEERIAPNPALGAMLRSLPQRKVIFTNANAGHAKRVLNALGIADCFDQIMDIFTVDPYCKPQLPAFEIALKSASIADAHRCAMLDDNQANLNAAHSFGIFTILANAETPAEGCDAAISSLLDLPKVLPE